MKTSIPLFELFFALLCLAVLPNAEAVNPPPDGGYPGFNTAEGQNALFSLTTGVGNAAVGWYSLFSNTDGSFNTAVGAGTLLFNIGDQITEDGTQNTAVGTAALLFNDSGSLNSALGVAALENNTTGFANTACGASVLQSNMIGTFNTASGVQALQANTNGNANTASGFGSLANNNTGNNNTAIGVNALFSNSTGSENTALGDNAGFNLTTGSDNVCIGVDVVGVAGESNITRIRNIGSTPIVGGTTVVIESTGGIGDARIGYASSSRRYKQVIQPMDKASETLFALKPVTFRAKSNLGSAQVTHYGLIAEDVERIDPNLVVYNAERKPETLRFDSINAMLLNEFLKEHRKVQQQESTIGELKSAMVQQRKEMEALVTRLNEQEARIQNVWAQIKVNTASLQLTAADNP